MSRDGLANAHEALAKATHGWSVREQEQLRRVSHTRRVAASRPDTLLARMPGREGVNPVERAGVATVTDALEKAIFGQPTALRRLSESIARAERPSGLRPHAEPATRPLMTALMFGPTGVGKTEVARTLARALFGSARAIVRIDCAELKQPHDLARLTGAPPGYVGHDRGGMLSDPLRRRPGSIVLFDEFEKATEALGELLLGILDDGRLTDGRGETVHFGQAIVLLTTNLGASALYREIGDDPPPTTELLETSERIARRLISERRPVLSPDGELEEVDGLGRPELEGLGRPELWSRLQDAVVGFDILRRDALDGIVRKYCQQLQANLGDEHDLRLTIRAGGFVEPIARRLEREGRWDGRSVAQLVRELVEGPLRPQLDGLPPGQIVTAIAGPGGAARIRPRGNGVEEGA